MVPFQNDGPVQVSDGNYEAFLNFCKEKGSNFDRLYYEAICQRNSGGFRRLCVRTLLRQTHFQRRRVNLYDTSMPVSRLFGIGGKGKKDELYWALYNCPTLLDMFTSELLYNFSHNYYNSELDTAAAGVYQLILLLLTLPLTEETAKALWWRHPLSQTPASTEQPLINSESHWHQAIKAWAFQKKLPEWIREELWNVIVSATQEEAKLLAQPPTATTVPIYLNWQDSQDIIKYPHLHTICTFIDLEADPAKTNPAIAEAYLGLLEDTLPAHVAYLPAETTLDCLDYIDTFPHNDTLTLRIMERHLTKFKLQRALKNGFRFSRQEVAALYGVLGRMYFYEPLDSDALKTVRKLIEVAQDPLNQCD